MRKLLSDLSDEPIYNMKAVEQQTTISAATLRAWERRYSLLEPKRTASGYRLYSDRDVALLHWVRTHMNEGLTISRVVAMLEVMRANHEPIWIDSADNGTQFRQDMPLPAVDLVRPLYEALINLDEDRASRIMDQAFAMYSMPTVYVELISPVLLEVGEAWHRGEIFIIIEHFATAYLRGRLLSILQSYPSRADMPSILIGCAPTEQHEVGVLIFTVMLRQQGYNALYLGPDVPVDDIVKMALHKRPAMICLSASSPPSALQLKGLQALLNRAPPPTPIFSYGGRAFDLNPELRKLVPGHYLGVDPRDGLKIVKHLLDSQANT